jgi:hypothetical protein
VYDLCLWYIASHIWYPNRASRNPFLTDQSQQTLVSSSANVTSPGGGRRPPSSAAPPPPSQPPAMYGAIGPNPQSPLAPMPSFDERASNVSSSSSRNSRVGSGDSSDYDDHKRVHRGGNYENLPFTFDVAMTAPFPQATPPLSSALAFTPCGRLLLSGNSWDDALATMSTSFAMNLDALARAQPGQRHRRGSCGDIKCAPLQQLVHHKVPLIIFGFSFVVFSNT